MTTNNYVPKDYEDLYRYYIIGDGGGSSLCDKLIRSMLPYGTPDEKETLTHDVFLRCMERNVLAVFDPKKANFGGVIFFVTRTIVSNHLSKKSRSPLTGLYGGSLTETDPEDGLFEPGTYSLDRLVETEQPSFVDGLEFKETLQELFDWAEILYKKPRHKRDESLFPLLGLLVQEYDPKECGKELGVTTSTVHNWLGVIRGKLRELHTV